ncbi:MAG: hypothetical protein EBW90_10005 [Rhodobacteraceae bacterium]|nr:hypothetical protein [Paracoccaceae bacterium]
MSVVINISKTYRTPIQTYSRLFELGASEKQNLAFLIGGCVISFVSQWPVQARYAFANQQSIDELMYYARRNNTTVIVAPTPVSTLNGEFAYISRPTTLASTTPNNYFSDFCLFWI